MKVCTKCGQTKIEEDFRWKHKNIGKRHSICKECASLRDSTYYHSLDPTRKEHIYAGRRKSKRRNNLFLIEYLKHHPCMDCGNSDIRVLDFDHVRGVKEFNLSVLKQKGCSIEHLQKEIEKCEVRCANCHRIRTSQKTWGNSPKCTDYIPAPSVNG